MKTPIFAESYASIQRVKMFKFVSKIFVIFFVATLSFGAPVEQDDYDEEGKESVQVLDGAFQMHNEELSAFKYELSDGNMREETIKTDDLDNGIAVRGSYTIDLGGGEMQTIYYISDVNGHRISINKPFPEEELNKPRIAPNWQENEKLERLAQGRSIDFEGKSADRSAAAQRVSSEGDESAGVQRRASEANGSAAAQRLTPGASSSAANQKGKLGAGLLLGAKKAGQKGASTADETEAEDSDADEQSAAQKAAGGASGSAAAQRLASLGGASAANQKGKLGAGSLLGSKKATSGAGQKGADETEADDSDADEEATTQKASAAAQRLASLRGASAGQRFSSGPGYSIESSHKGGAGSLFKAKKTTTDTASLVVSQRPSPAPIENKDRFTQSPKATPTRVSSVRERPRVASLPDRPKNIEFHKDDDNDNDDAEKEKEEDEEKVADDEVKSDESEVPEEKKVE